MPAKTILTLLFLASLGVVAILGLRALPRHLDAGPSGKAEMLVASAALAPGTLLRAKDVAWQPVTERNQDRPDPAPSSALPAPRATSSISRRGRKFTERHCARQSAPASRSPGKLS